MRTRKLVVGLVAALVALALPAASSAKTKAVFMGTPPSAAKQFNALGADANDFFPHGITVHVGDSVAFAPVGFHTIDFPAAGGTPLDLITPTGDKVANSKDAAGQPFWFNGQDVLGFNPLLLASKYGKTVSYSGAKRVDSGLPLGNKLKPIKVKFTKKGSFTYYCNIHPGMKGTVRVVGKKTKTPSVKADAKVVKNQVKADLTIAKSLPKKTPPANTVNVGSAGPKGVEFYGFVPGTVNVHVGDSITFRMTKASFETHTATTGPGDPNTEPNSYLGALSASFQGTAPDPAAVYPSDPPGSAAATLTPELHGNGFWSSGALDTAPATPLPGSNTVKFGAAGTYQFYCLIHPFMHATVNVQ
jgi:plastocyanin